jgi:hypothetical protein
VDDIFIVTENHDIAECIAQELFNDLPYIELTASLEKCSFIEIENGRLVQSFEKALQLKKGESITSRTNMKTLGVVLSAEKHVRGMHFVEKGKRVLEILALALSICSQCFLEVAKACVTVKLIPIVMSNVISPRILADFDETLRQIVCEKINIPHDANRDLINFPQCFGGVALPSLLQCQLPAFIGSKQRVAAANEDSEVLQESIHFVLEESDKFLPFGEDIVLPSSQAEHETEMDNSERRRIIEDTSEFPSFGLEHVLHRIKKLLTKGEMVVLEDNEKLQYKLWMLAMKRKLDIILRKLPQHLKVRLKNNGSPSACAWLRKFPTESRTFLSDEKVRIDLSFRLLSDQYTRSEYSDITNQLGLEKTKRARTRDEDADEEQRENAAEYETIDEEEEGEKKEKEDDEEEEEEE